MLAGPQDHPVDGVFVHSQQTCCGSYTDSLGRMVDDQPNRFGRQMQTEQRAGPGGRKTLAAGTAIQQNPVFVLAVLGANANVAVPSQAVVLALFVGTEALFELAHGLPTALKLI